MSRDLFLRFYKMRTAGVPMTAGTPEISFGQFAHSPISKQVKIQIHTAVRQNQELDEMERKAARGEDLIPPV